MTKKEIALKYLAMIQTEIRQRQDQYYKSLKSTNNKREQLKLVEKYHKDVAKIIAKHNQKGLVELGRLNRES